MGRWEASRRKWLRDLVIAIQAGTAPLQPAFGPCTPFPSLQTLQLNSGIVFIHSLSKPSLGPLVHAGHSTEQGQVPAPAQPRIITLREYSTLVGTQEGQHPLWGERGLPEEATPPRGTGRRAEPGPKKKKKEKKPSVFCYQHRAQSCGKERAE